MQGSERKDFDLDEVDGGEPDETQEAARGEPITVVVADDHPMWRDAVARDLADGGFVIVGTASDGPSAIRRTLATTASSSSGMPSARGSTAADAQVVVCGVAARRAARTRPSMPPGVSSIS